MASSRGRSQYVYLTPLVAPTGERFEEAPPAEGFDKNAIAVGAAHDAGKLDFAPMLSAPRGKPVSFIFASAYGIPEGSTNIEGAKAFIDWQMQVPRISNSLSGMVRCRRLSLPAPTQPSPHHTGKPC